jgi:hypothetical protein
MRTSRSPTVPRISRVEIPAFGLGLEDVAQGRADHGVRGHAPALRQRLVDRHDAAVFVDHEEPRVERVENA